MSEPITRGRDHPLINALFDTLPAPAAGFTAAQRTEWLKVMESAFTVAYGAPGGETMRQTARPAAPKAPAAKKPAKPKPSKPKASAKPKPKKVGAPIAAARGHEFFIDAQGIARREDGERIMHNQVTGYLVDMRGENGNLNTITWADGSQGIPKGVQLDISVP